MGYAINFGQNAQNLVGNQLTLELDSTVGAGVPGLSGGSFHTGDLLVLLVGTDEAGTGPPGAVQTPTGWAVDFVWNGVLGTGGLFHKVWTAGDSMQVTVQINNVRATATTGFVLYVIRNEFGGTVSYAPALNNTNLNVGATPAVWGTFTPGQSNDLFLVLGMSRGASLSGTPLWYLQGGGTPIGGFTGNAFLWSLLTGFTAFAASLATSQALGGAVQWISLTIQLTDSANSPPAIGKQERIERGLFVYAAHSPIGQGQIQGYGGGVSVV